MVITGSSRRSRCARPAATGNPRRRKQRTSRRSRISPRDWGSHDHFEKTHAKHNWWDWYGAYMSARQSGSNPDESSAAADRHMEEVLRILPR